MSEIKYNDLKDVINKIITDQNIKITDFGVSEDSFNGQEPCFDMALVKLLKGSNVGDKGNSASSNQSSILLTGEQSTIFPVLKRDSFYGKTVGKMRIMKIPMLIMSNNELYIKGQSINNENNVITSWITTNETTNNRIEAGCKVLDGEEYVKFYESLSSDSVIIILKVMSCFKYIFLAVKNEDINKYFGSINIDNDNRYYMFSLNKITKNNTSKITYINPENIEEINTDIAFNRLVAGAPGTGKSYFIEGERVKYFGNNYERVTFYPDYTYGQFVGMYKPVMNKANIEYKFVPGPFLRLYVQAYKNKEKNFLLIIEEINRGNAASIFGDIFQLLDRCETGEGEYSVTISEDIKKYLKLEIGKDLSEIKMLDNLYIWATMNTADQGVCPMDSAFKRRFDEYKLMNINENEDAIENYLVNIKCNDIGEVYWNKFRKKLNDYLIKLGIAEDKLIGPFFIKPDILRNDGKFQEAFTNKLIMYLMEDVLKHRKAKLFVSNSLSDVISHYKKSERVFCEEFVEAIEDGNLNE